MINLETQKFKLSSEKDFDEFLDYVGNTHHFRLDKVTKPTSYPCIVIAVTVESEYQTSFTATYVNLTDFTGDKVFNEILWK